MFVQVDGLNDGGWPFFRPPVFLWKNATKTRGRAPPLGLTPPKGFGHGVSSRLGLVWADVQGLN